MRRFFSRMMLSTWICLVMAIGSLPVACSQTIRVSCPEFFNDRHQAIACTEAIFSQNHYHFTLASLPPPSNGFGPGIVLVTRIRNTVGTPARENALDLSLTGAATTNSSWFAGGDMLWLPPLLYKADPSVANGLRLGDLRSIERMSVHLSAGHRTVRTLYFYGEGSRRRIRNTSCRGRYFS